VAAARWTASDHAKLLESSSAREFLLNCLNIRKERGLPYSYAFVSRVSGFAARSFPRDVVCGKKSLSIESAIAIAKGLKFTADLKEFFLALVAVTNTENESDLRKKIHRVNTMRDRLSRRALERDNEADSAFAIKNFATVYAALGSEENGASMIELIERTRLSKSNLVSTIEELLKIGLIKIDNHRYYPCVNHLAFSQLKDAGAFHHQYLTRLKQAEGEARRNFSSPQALFQESTILVREDRLVELKSELRNLLLKFVDESVDAAGNRIASVLVAMLPIS
jgi:uncharacterized protein (TIGR02147 family)